MFIVNIIQTLFFIFNVIIDCILIIKIKIMCLYDIDDKHIILYIYIFVSILKTIMTKNNINFV